MKRAFIDQKLHNSNEGLFSVQHFKVTIESKDIYDNVQNILNLISCSGKSSSDNFEYTSWKFDVVDFNVVERVLMRLEYDITIVRN